MAAPPPVQTIQQKVVTVANNDSAINTEIDTQALTAWAATLLIISGSNVIIMFARPYVET